MSDLSANLALPYMQPSQAQKHVTHNEALERLDVLAQLSLEAFATLTPPSTPVEGEAHGVGAGAGGAWAGQDGRIAAWLGGAWVFLDPATGWRAWGRAEAGLRVWDGTAWTPVGGDLNNMAGLGIGTSWDTTNRLAVTSEAALFTHAGAGHQIKINKAGVSDTASLLYQTNWSGRAEMGLAGNDDLAVKVSDGTSWFDAITVDHTSGAVAVPTGLTPDYVSAWVEIDATTAPTTGTDFAHNLAVADPYILDIQVWFYPGTGTRAFLWSGSSPVASASNPDRFDGSVSIKDANTITISVGNSGVFAKDNVDGGATSTYTSGYFLVIANKVPGLPAFPT